MKKPTKGDAPPSQLIADLFTELGDWRGKLMALLRKLVLHASPDITDEKWGTPIWTSNGMVCSAAAFKDHVNLNFFKGASLKDPNHPFNAGLEAKATRSIDFKAAVAYNSASQK
ncbi:MAG TPA: DUF1801 domain-containing protein [Pyrinomonadaceae bacterium]|nr:DUF1801 domain-containing protein [Pyrinomonadaceae bacterium]